jgi:geranylgeranyl diphosphate synthase type II
MILKEKNLMLMKTANAGLENEGFAFSDYLSLQRKKVDDALDVWCSSSKERVMQASAYSLMLPSKRLRPLFCLETCRAFLGADEAALPAAMALEMVHTYSLIHDDLPAMDNDDLRRGKPTNHKVYGEATALLAGSALLTAAFEILAKADGSSARVRMNWVRELSEAAGASGMVLGQDWDIDPPEEITLDFLQSLHRKKTGALLAASVVMGAMAAEMPQTICEELREFALDMGLAFQIRDDVLDVIGGAEIGKPVNSDERNSKKTYVSLLGLEKAKRETEFWYDLAITKLRSLRLPHANRLEELTRFVIDRRS